MPSSSFNGEAIFDSGPHRFAIEAEGTLVVPWIAFGSTTPGSRVLGALELGVLVTGRLVAGDESGLDDLLSAMRAQLTSPPTVGDLVDAYGRIYTDMSFVRLEAADRTDRGRTVSLAYTARFLRVAT